MAGKSGGNKMTKKKSGKSTRARKSDAPVVEENVELISDGNNSDDLPEHPSERIKGQKRRRPSTGGGVSSRTRARKAVSCGNESIGEEAVQQVSAPVRDTTVISRSVDGESEDMSAVSSKERQPPQPLELYFKSTEYPKTCKIQTKCKMKETVDVIKGFKEEVSWFTSHPQFRHFFHMPDEEFLKLQGMWMLLMRTIRIEGEDVAWFAVNGVPIRYSMREHALISGLDCHEYPRRHLELGSSKFVDYYFGGKKKITIIDVKQKLESMETACIDRLKMAVLFFLGRVIRGNSGQLDPFILRIVDDLDVCRNFPWGRLTFEDAIKEIKHVMERLKGEVHYATGFNGFIIPLEVLAFECIPKLGKKFRISSDGASGDCPRMCKSRFTKSSMKGYPLEDIYDAFRKTKTINSVLVPTVDEETLLARIIDPEPEYHREGSTSDRWNYWLNVKQKKIWWKELYESDVAARVFTKTKDKEKVTVVEGSSSNSGLKSILKGLEERLVKSMEEGFSGINLTVETKLEPMYWTMGELEKNQRLLKRSCKKIEERLTSMESKGNEDVEYRQWDDFSYGRDHDKDGEMAEAEKNKEMAEAEKDKEENSEKDEEDEENNEKGEEDEENSGKEEEDEQNSGRNSESAEESGEKSLDSLRERAKVQGEEFWKRFEAEKEAEKKEAEKQEAEKEAERRLITSIPLEETPTPPRGRTKAEVRKHCITPPGKVRRLKWKKCEDIALEEEKKDEETVEESSSEKEKKDEEIAEEEAEKMVEEEVEVPEKETEKMVEEEVEVAEKEAAKMVEEEVEVAEKEAEKMVEEEVEVAEKEAEKMVEEEVEVAEKEAEKMVEEEVEVAEKEAEKMVEEEVEVPEEEAENYTEKQKQGWHMVVYEPEEASRSGEAAKPDVGTLKTKRRRGYKVMAVKGGITRAERLAKMKAQATTKKRGRPKKIDATLKPCTPLREKRKCEPSRWVQSPFTEGKTDELEEPKKKPKTKA